MVSLSDDNATVYQQEVLKQVLAQHEEEQAGKVDTSLRNDSMDASASALVEAEA